MTNVKNSFFSKLVIILLVILGSISTALPAAFAAGEVSCALSVPGEVSKNRNFTAFLNLNGDGTESVAAGVFQIEFDSSVFGFRNAKLTGSGEIKSTCTDGVLRIVYLNVSGVSSDSQNIIEITFNAINQADVSGNITVYVEQLASTDESMLSVGMGELYEIRVVGQASSSAGAASGTKVQNTVSEKAGTGGSGSSGSSGSANGSSKSSSNTGSAAKNNGDSAKSSASSSNNSAQLAEGEDFADDFGKSGSASLIIGENNGHNKNNLFFIGGIIIALAVAGGGLALYKAGKKSSQSKHKVDSNNEDAAEDNEDNTKSDEDVKA